MTDVGGAVNDDEDGDGFGVEHRDPEILLSLLRLSRSSQEPHSSSEPGRRRLLHERPVYCQVQ